MFIKFNFFSGLLTLSVKQLMHLSDRVDGCPQFHDYRKGPRQGCSTILPVVIHPSQKPRAISPEYQNTCRQFPVLPPSNATIPLADSPFCNFCNHRYHFCYVIKTAALQVRVQH